MDATCFERVAGLRGLEGPVYEGGIHVPMIVPWIGRIEPGAVSDHVSAFRDMVATFADLTGGTHPEGIDVDRTPSHIERWSFAGDGNGSGGPSPLPIELDGGDR